MLPLTQNQQNVITAAALQCVLGNHTESKVEIPHPYETGEKITVDFHSLEVQVELWKSMQSERLFAEIAILEHKYIAVLKEWFEPSLKLFIPATLEKNPHLVAYWRSKEQLLS